MTSSAASANVGETRRRPARGSAPARARRRLSWAGLARLGQRDQLGAAEAEIAPGAVDREALHPGLAAAAGTGLDEQIETIAVAVAHGAGRWV